MFLYILECSRVCYSLSIYHSECAFAVCIIYKRSLVLHVRDERETISARAFLYNYCIMKFPKYLVALSAVGTAVGGFVLYKLVYLSVQCLGV